MKSIMIEIPYGNVLILPPGCAAFLPGALIAEMEGYDRNKLTATAIPIDARFLDPDSIKPIPPAVPVPIPDDAPLIAVADGVNPAEVAKLRDDYSPF